MAKKNIESIDTRSRLAKGIDYFSIRVTIFLIALITLSQIGINFYISVILASFGTAFINRQINAFKQKKLTSLARKKSSEKAGHGVSEVKEADKQQEIEEKVKSNQHLSFFLSGLFLLGLSVFFQEWFKYYFISFSVLNFTLAGFYYYRVKKGLKKEVNKA